VAAVAIVLLFLTKSDIQHLLAAQVARKALVLPSMQRLLWR
jgi:hypothetical protein